MTCSRTQPGVTLRLDSDTAIRGDTRVRQRAPRGELHEYGDNDHERRRDHEGDQGDDNVEDPQRVVRGWRLGGCFCWLGLGYFPEECRILRQRRQSDRRVENAPGFREARFVEREVFDPIRLVLGRVRYRVRHISVIPVSHYE